MNIVSEKIKTFTIKQKYILRLINGDLTLQNTDVIVNAANKDLYLGSGVAGAIKKKFGSLVQQKCNTIMEKEKFQLKNGEVRETDTIGLKLNDENKDIKYIFHAVGPIYKDGKYNERKDLENCFLNSFDLANKLRLESISLPPISSGIFHFPKDECADIFFTCFINFFMLNNFNKNNSFSLKEINMVIIDNITYNIFEEKMSYFYKKWNLENFEVEIVS
jgi:O-acetyl-ADP-ribose deacetylase (regulator of RNase III)